MNFPRYPRVPSFRVGGPQRLAALLLLIFLGECLWIISRQSITSTDYRYARCGREMWERPSPLAGYFTTCGNLNGDGLLAYRVAGFPLTAQRLLLLGADKLRKPADRLYAQGTLNGSTWEARHEVSFVKYLMHLPFVLFAMWLGGGLWWVARRLFGNEGGFLALALYIFSPQVIRYAVVPNNEILAMWGLYGLVYTAMGVAHAMQGPPRKWKPRILLLTVALGLTVAAHLLAAMLGFVASLAFMLYLAERRRSATLLVLTYAAFGALILDFACFSFHPAAFTYVATGGAARFWFSLDGVKAFAADQTAWPILLAFAIALLLFGALRRSRYFGNLAPLLMVLFTCILISTQIVSSPVIWALPFLFTFIGGVFADVLETKYRKLFLATGSLLLLTEAVACLAALPSLTQNCPAKARSDAASPTASSFEVGHTIPTHLAACATFCLASALNVVPPPREALIFLRYNKEESRSTNDDESQRAQVGCTVGLRSGFRNHRLSPQAQDTFSAEVRPVRRQTETHR